MWDATQMANWINNSCKVTSPINVLDKLQNVDRNFPKKAQKIIDKLQKENKLEDTSEIVCALYDHQKIMFIYLKLILIIFLIVNKFILNFIYTILY